MQLIFVKPETVDMSFALTPPGAPKSSPEPWENSWIGSQNDLAQRWEGNTASKFWRRSEPGGDCCPLCVFFLLTVSSLYKTKIWAKRSLCVITHGNDRSAALLSEETRGQRTAGCLECNNWLERRGLLLGGGRDSGVGSNFFYSFLSFEDM